MSLFWIVWRTFREFSENDADVDDYNYILSNGCLFQEIMGRNQK